MAIYIQGAFILVSLGFWAVAGDGGMLLGFDGGPMEFPVAGPGSAPAGYIWIFVSAGVFLSAGIGYSLSQAYRLGTASVVASYEIRGPAAGDFLGWLIFGEIPGAAIWLGTATDRGGGPLRPFARGAGPRGNRVLPRRRLSGGGRGAGEKTVPHGPRARLTMPNGGNRPRVHAGATRWMRGCSQLVTKKNKSYRPVTPRGLKIAGSSPVNRGHSSFNFFVCECPSGRLSGWFCAKPPLRAA